jgi:hypothetical protein
MAEKIVFMSSDSSFDRLPNISLTVYNITWWVLGALRINAENYKWRNNILMKKHFLIWSIIEKKCKDSIAEMDTIIDKLNQSEDIIVTKSLFIYGGYLYLKYF